VGDTVNRSRCSRALHLITLSLALALVSLSGIAVDSVFCVVIEEDGGRARCGGRLTRLRLARACAQGRSPD